MAAVTPFETQIQAKGGIALGSGQVISGISAASATGHPVEYDQWIAAQVDFRPKLVAKAATTAALPANTASNGGKTLTADANGAFPTVDDVSSALNQLYLVKNESAGSKNLLFELTQLGDASNPWILTAHSRFDTATEVRTGTMVVVDEGTANGGKIFYVSSNGINSDGDHTVGTTAVTWSATAGGTATTVASGYTDALTISANEISIDEVLLDIAQITAAGVGGVKIVGIDENVAAVNVELGDTQFFWNNAGTLTAANTGTMGRTILGYGGTNPAAGVVQLHLIDENGAVSSVDVGNDQIVYNNTGTPTALTMGATGKALLQDTTADNAAAELECRSRTHSITGTGSATSFKVPNPFNQSKIQYTLQETDGSGYGQVVQADVSTFDDAGTPSVRVEFAVAPVLNALYTLTLHQIGSTAGSAMTAE